ATLRGWPVAAPSGDPRRSVLGFAYPPSPAFCSWRALTTAGAPRLDRSSITSDPGLGYLQFGRWRRFAPRVHRLRGFAIGHAQRTERADDGERGRREERSPVGPDIARAAGADRGDHAAEGGHAECRPELALHVGDGRGAT